MVEFFNSKELLIDGENAFNKFILPHKNKSDLIVNNSKNNNSAPEAILEYIIKESGIN